MLVHPIFEIDVELVLEGVPPVVLVGQYLHALLKVCRQESLRDVETLKLRYGVQLLLSFIASIFERLILLLYPLYFSLDFLLPLGFLSLPPLVVALLVLSDLVELVLFLDLESRLLDGLAEEDVEDGLDLDIIIKEVIVLDLCDLVDASLLGHVFRSGRFRLESVGLQFDFCLIRLDFTLLRQKIR